MNMAKQLETKVVQKTNHKGSHSGHEYNYVCRCAMCKRITGVLDRYSHLIPQQETASNEPYEITREEAVKYIFEHPDVIQPVTSEQLIHHVETNPDLFMTSAVSLIQNNPDKLPNDIILYKVPDNVIECIINNQEKIKEEIPSTNFRELMNSLITNSIIKANG